MAPPAPYERADLIIRMARIADERRAVMADERGRRGGLSARAPTPPSGGWSGSSCLRCARSRRSPQRPTFLAPAAPLDARSRFWSRAARPGADGLARASSSESIATASRRSRRRRSSRPRRAVAAFSWVFERLRGCRAAVFCRRDRGRALDGLPGVRVGAAVPAVLGVTAHAFFPAIVASLVLFGRCSGIGRRSTRRALDDSCTPTRASWSSRHSDKTLHSLLGVDRPALVLDDGSAGPRAFLGREAPRAAGWRPWWSPSGACTSSGRPGSGCCSPRGA